MRLFWLLCVSMALLVGGLLGGVSQAIAAQPPAVDGVTYGQPQVIPGEFNGDLSKLPSLPVTIGEPPIYRPLLKGPPSEKPPTAAPPPSAPQIIGGPLAPMPSPIQNFAGLSKTDSCIGGTCGAGWPPDTNGDVGPNHYIQVVNSAVAIYNKTGTLLASFTENNLWSGVGTTACNGHSQGDPVALYDWLADRFVITWFAFATSGGSPVSPYYQCIAASKTSDPVAGGWWLYAVRMDPGSPSVPVGNLNDYPKFGLWHDCLYMAANEFTFPPPSGSFAGVSFASFSRSDLYSGAALTYSLGFLAYPANKIFAMVPSNNQGKGANAVQPGTLNYFVSESITGFSFDVRKFTPGVNCGAGGTLGSATSVSQTSYSYSSLGNEVPQPNTTNTLDNIDDRIMQRVQYRKISGAESLWVTHNVDTATGGPTAMQWAQINVTGGTIVTTPVQQQIYAPDATLWRWMGSLSVDSQGNMALAYSTSNGTSLNFPSIAYSGRLAGDPLNTLPQTETQLIAGTGSQTNNCGGLPCHRWGDYSAMNVDPADDCTFWYTTEYYSSQTNGTAGNWQTRIGSFKFPSCTPPGADLAIAKTHGGNFTQGQTGATYAITVTNVGGTPSSGTVTVTDTLPPGLTATSIGGSGWTCTQPSGPCTRSDALAASASYPAITLTVNVAADAPASVTNTATVSGGGDTNSANNTASDATTVIRVLMPGTRATVYRPVSVCRLVDTRGLPAAITIAGPLAPNSSTNINAAGFCGIPTNGRVAGISLSFHVFNYTVFNGGYISFLQQGAPIAGVNAVFNPGAQWTAATANVSIPDDSGNFYVYVAQSQIDLIIDVNGYYQDLDDLDVGTQQLMINGNMCAGCDLLQLTNTGPGSALTLNSPLGAAVKINTGTVRAAGAGVGTNTFAFLHQVNTAAFGSGGTICGGSPAYSIIDHPMLNNDAGAIMIIRPRDDAVSGTNVHAAVAYEVYNMASGMCTPSISGNKWTIHSVDNSALANNLQFNVIVIKP